ncbi:MAG: lysoplasmalogenase [Lachnospiraceae bacterium]|nr:lysoplasmalogenase [Lachnospiraceae bacterium]
MRRRKFTKPFLIPLILLYYVTSTDHLIWFLVLALIFSWLGDVFLMFQGNTWFTVGGCFFGVSHIFFVLTYVNQIHWSVVRLSVLIPVAVVYIAITTLIILAVIKQTPKKMLPAMYLYLIANSTMNVFAVMQLESMPSAGSIIALVGAILFFISDCSLFLVRYSKHPEWIFKKHFTVMLTYIVGEFLITQGILMLVG